MNKDVSNLKTNLSAANDNLMKSQKEKKETLAKLFEVSAKSKDKDELESVKRELKSVETRCERLQTFLRNLKQSKEKLLKERESLMKEKETLSNEKKILSQEKEKQLGLNEKLKVALQQKEADIAKKEAKTNAMPLVIKVTPSSSSATKTSNSKQGDKFVSGHVEPPTPAPTPAATPTPPVEAAPITLDAIMDDNSTPQIPTNGFKFAAGSRKKEDDKSEAGAVLDKEKCSSATEGEVSTESALRARLLKKKRKLAEELKVNAEQGVASSTSNANLEGREDTEVTPVAKRERLNEAVFTKPQEGQEKSITHDVTKAAEQEAAASIQAGSEFPFISNLKPPSSDAIVGKFVFGTSANIQLPVPSGGAIRPLTTSLFGSASSSGVNPFAVVAPDNNKSSTIVVDDKSTEKSMEPVKDEKASDIADAADEPETS